MPVVEQRVLDDEHQVGRNDPCWCGAGKKFKKCHGGASARQLETQASASANTGTSTCCSVEEVETPQPGEGEVLLRVKAAGINPIDWKVLHGGLAGGQPLAEPRGLGVDVAGVIEKIGPGVRGPLARRGRARQLEHGRVRRSTR